MAPRESQRPSLPVAEANICNLRKLRLAMKPCTSSCSEKRKRGRPRKFVFISSSDSDNLKNSVSLPTAATTESPPTANTFTSQTAKISACTESATSKNAPAEAVAVSEATRTDLAAPGQSCASADGNIAFSNLLAAALQRLRRGGDRNWQPPQRSFRKSPRKGKPTRAPFF